MNALLDFPLEGIEDILDGPGERRMVIAALPVRFFPSGKVIFFAILPGSDDNLDFQLPIEELTAKGEEFLKPVRFIKVGGGKRIRSFFVYDRQVRSYNSPGAKASSC